MLARQMSMHWEQQGPCCVGVWGSDEGQTRDLMGDTVEMTQTGVGDPDVPHRLLITFSVEKEHVCD